MFQKLMNLNTTDSSSRIEIIDFFKGSSVLLVLLHHVNVPYGKFILAFHMPLFFLLSGYIYGQTNSINNKTFGTFLKQKSSKILVPYIGFEFINLLLSFIFVKNINLPNALISIFLCINLESYSGITLRLWFLPCIFIGELFFYLTVKHVPQKKNICISALVFLIAAYLLTNYLPFRLPFTLDISITATAFILLGYGLSDAIFTIRKYQKSFLHYIFLLCLLFLFILAAHYNEKLLMYENEYGNYFLAIISSLTGSYLFLYLVNAIYKKKILKCIYTFILFLGKNSLLFFPIHLIILFFTDKLLLRINLNIWYTKFAIVAIICIPLINFARLYLPVLSGQNIKRNK